MLKRFLIAVIVAVLVTTSQIAAAADGNAFKHCKTKAELARWIENGRRKGQTEFNFTLLNSNVTAEEISNEIAVDAGGRGGFVSGYFTYYVNELPGTRVANAYLSGDKSELTTEEVELYNEAIRIIVKAKEYSRNNIERERYIHDEICRRANPMKFNEYRYYFDENGDYIRDNYGNKKIKPFATAIGAIINRQANCSGYSDAFYMLCRMIGLDVVRVGGIHIGGSNHGWNAIKINGNVYFVDVYWDDEGNTGEFFNKSAEFFRKEHSWNYLAF